MMILLGTPIVLRQRHGSSHRVTGGLTTFHKRIKRECGPYTSYFLPDTDSGRFRPGALICHCRRAMNSGGRLLLAEMVLPEGDVPHPGKMLDMIMLTVTGGEERTASQYGALLDDAGFRMTRVVPTASLVSVLEAVPAG